MQVLYEQKKEIDRATGEARGAIDLLASLFVGSAVIVVLIARSRLARHTTWRLLLNFLTVLILAVIFFWRNCSRRQSDCSDRNAREGLWRDRGHLAGHDDLDHPCTAGDCVRHFSPRAVELPSYTRLRIAGVMPRNFTQITEMLQDHAFSGSEQLIREATERRIHSSHAVKQSRIFMWLAI
jgi:hypothetical protein